MTENNIPQHLINALVAEFKNDHDYDPEWDYEADARRYITALNNANTEATIDNTDIGDHVLLTGEGWRDIPGLHNKRVLITDKSVEHNELYFHDTILGEMAVILSGEECYTATKVL